MKALGINGWFKVFEPSLIKDASGTVSLPMKRGQGMCKLAKFEGGASAYGIFVSCLPIAMGAVPRGTLVFTDADGTKPHDAESLSLITGFPTVTIQNAIDLLISIGWLETVEFEVGGIPRGKPTPPLDLFLTDLGAKLTHNSVSLMPEWQAAVKGLAPSVVRRVFADTKPGITFPRDFVRARAGMGL